MHSEQPMVTAIMPTRGRRQWAVEALAMFEAQTWPNKEIVIVDDNLDRSFPDGVTGARYILASRLAIGAKRNLAIAAAQGEIIMHWDSDDIYTPDRMAHQASLLIEQGPAVNLVGYSRVPWIEADGEQRSGVYQGLPGYCVGVSFCYWREAWKLNRFALIDVGEDGYFQDKMRAHAVDSEGRITFRVHGGNTAEKRTGIAKDPKRWEVSA